MEMYEYVIICCYICVDLPQDTWWQSILYIFCLVWYFLVGLVAWFCWVQYHFFIHIVSECMISRVKGETAKLKNKLKKVAHTTNMKKQAPKAQEETIQS